MSKSTSHSAAAVTQLHQLLSLPTDQDRLDGLKHAWTSQPTVYLEKLVQAVAKELDQKATEYASVSSPVPLSAHMHVRNLLGLTGLLARREYENMQKLPVQVFPGCISSMLVILAAPERQISGNDASAQQSGGALRFHALHAFNRLLEAFPPIAGTFVKLVVQQCTKDLFASVNTGDESSAVSSASTAASVDPSYGVKLLETIGLIVATLPREVVGQGHTMLLQALKLIDRCLEGIEEYERPPPTQKPTAAAGSSSAPATTKGKKGASALPPPAMTTIPAPLAPEHTLVLSLLDLSATLLKKLHMRMPVAYPSSAMLHPRSWPFGSEELGVEEGEEKDGEDGDAGGNKDEEGKEDEEDDTIEEEDEDEENHTNTTGTKHTIKPRQYYTSSLEFNPARGGCVPMQFASEEAASLLFTSVLHKLRVMYEKVGTEVANESAPACINDSGVTLLSFMPYMVVLDNLYGRKEGDSHSVLLAEQSQWLLTQLQLLDLSQFSPTLASASQQYLGCMEKCMKYTDRSRPGVVEEIHSILYEPTVNWLSDASTAFPRLQFLKLRRWAVSMFLGLFYVLDTQFQSLIGTKNFFEDLFKLLANPLITSHLVWWLRQDAAHLEKNVLPLIMRGLLHTNTRSSPSMKTVCLILTSIGNVACFSRGVKTEPSTTPDATVGTDGSTSPPQPAAPAATLPLLAPYLSAILETILNTTEKSPSGTGQIGALVLARILLAGYEMEEVQDYLSRIFTFFYSILNESLFVAEQQELGEDYDSENDQDLVSQLQYCVYDMLHVCVQDMNDSTIISDPISRGVPPADHPFNQAKFLQVIQQDEECVEVVRDIVKLILENTKKPIFFNDDAALRNSEIHLLKEICAHRELFQEILKPEKPKTDEQLEESDKVTALPADESKDSASSPAIRTTPLPPLTPVSLITTLLQSILLAKEDGQRERKENYLICLASLTTSINSLSSDLHTQVKTALSSQDPVPTKLMNEVRKDADTWKILRQAGWTK